MENFTFVFQRLVSLVETTGPRVAELMIEKVLPPDLLSAEQKMVVDSFRQSLNDEEIRRAVPDFEYLEKQQGYMNNVPLRLKLLDIVRSGLGSLIKIRSMSIAELEDSLDWLAKSHEIKLEIMRSNIRDFDYLESRSWFNRDLMLQDKLGLVVAIGLGSKVSVLAPDFNAHLDRLLDRAMGETGVGSKSR